ncbi:MAG TPA: hypothetical protein VJJ83_03790, partial [Candidatus Babeliales bacterium]|nr:hypothetical protein [Candidatus Babeliales bacterium]
AQCYAQAVRQHQFKTAGNLVSQLAQQLRWAHSAAAGTAQLTLAELGGVTQQITQLLDWERATELGELIEDAEFTGTGLAVTLGELQALALVWQQAGEIVELDPIAVSERVATACDRRLWRILHVQQLAAKYVTPANIAWLQQALAHKLCPSAKG